MNEEEKANLMRRLKFMRRFAYIGLPAGIVVAGFYAYGLHVVMRVPEYTEDVPLFNAVMWMGIVYAVGSALSLIATCYLIKKYRDT